MISYKLKPFDTLFFRDGSPFNLGETGQMEVEGTFPPSPTTVVGAMRAALAQAKGWDISQDWSDNTDLYKMLGSHQTLGEFNFQGPYILRDQELLFPAPLLLLGRAPAKKGEAWSGLTRLKPSSPEKTLQCDIGEKVRFPEPESTVKGLKSLEKCWLTSTEMSKLLKGDTPEVVIDQKNYQKIKQENG